MNRKVGNFINMGAFIALTAICGLRMLQAALSFGVFVADLFGEVIVWRGHRLRVSGKEAIEGW